MYNLGLIVDESHAVGIYGAAGAGLIEHLGIRDQVLCSINGLGKAFGCYGAFVAGCNEVIELILQRARTLMFTTALPPLALCAIEQALSIIKHGHRQRALLRENIAQLQNALLPSRKELSPIIPVIVQENARALELSLQMEQAGFDIKAIRPPSVPKNTARLRITTNLNQSPELINNFLSVLLPLL